MDMNLANSGRQWRTGKPGVLQSMGWQRVWHDLEIEQQQRKGKLEIVFSRELLELCDGRFHKFLPISEDVIFPSIMHFRGLLEQGTYVTAPLNPPSPKQQQSLQQLGEGRQQDLPTVPSLGEEVRHQTHTPPSGPRSCSFPKYLLFSNQVHSLLVFSLEFPTPVAS